MKLVLKILKRKLKETLGLNEVNIDLVSIA